MSAFEVEGGGVTLRGDDDGDGAPIVLLHGLSATRRYVLHGSTALVRDGYRLIAYDSRGHGESGPAPAPGAYDYATLVDDARDGCPGS
jgi:pimeloyl-ACP methyl ester carboxylesterase